jgi:hypothetical protein
VKGEIVGMNSSLNKYTSPAGRPWSGRRTRGRVPTRVRSQKSTKEHPVNPINFLLGTRKGSSFQDGENIIIN